MSEEQGKQDSRDYYEQRMVEAALRERSDDAPDLGAEIVAAARGRTSRSADIAAAESAGEPPTKRKPLLTFKRTWFLAAGLAGLVVLPAAANWAYRAWQRHELRDSKVRLLVSAPPAIPDGSPLRFHVETHNLAREKMLAQIDWKVLDANGDTLTEATTVCHGTADITVAGRLTKPRKLVVTARVPRTGFSKTIEQAIHPSQSAPLVHVTSDKPAYRPGEPVMLRIACLDRLTLRGAEYIGLRCRIVDPKSSPVQNTVLRVGKGVAAWTWRVPPSTAGGTYALEVRDNKDEFTLERLEFLVRNFQPPKLKKKVTLDQQTYAPGQSGDAVLAVTRATGGPAAGAKAHATLVVDGNETWQGDAILDGEGLASFRFKVPGEVERGAARFVARVTDGGNIETELKPFVIPTDKVEVALYPEGGDLIAGSENRVYAQVRNALGRPLSGEGQIVDDEGTAVAPFKTVHMGRTRFAFTPVAGRSYKLKLTTPAEKSFDLPEVHDTGVVLQPVGDWFAAGEPARCQVFAAGKGPWIAAVFCRGVLVGQHSILARGHSVVSVPLVKEASGVLRVTVFDSKLRPVAERLVSRDARRNLVVTVTPETKRSTPGSKQKVKVRTTDETGEPVSCVVGLTVSDRSVEDMLDFVRTGLADQRQLFTDVEKPDERVEEFLAGSSEYRRNVDLLLGSMGWRRYVWRGDADEKALVAAGGDWAKSLPVREGRSWGPVVTDNLGEYEADVLWANLSRFEAKKWTYGFSVLALIVFGLLGLVHVFSRLARRFEWRPPLLVGSLVTATVVATIGFASGWFARDVDMAPGAAGMPVADAFNSPTLIDSLVSVAMSPDEVVLEQRIASANSRFFYDDGCDGDVRGRSENFFNDSLGQSWNYVRDFDVQVAQGAVIVDAEGLNRYLALPNVDLYQVQGNALDALGYVPRPAGRVTTIVDDLNQLPAFVPPRLPFNLGAGGMDNGREPSVDRVVDAIERFDHTLEELKTLDPQAQTRIALLEAKIRQDAVLLDLVNQRYPGIFETIHPLITGTVSYVNTGADMIIITLESGAENLRSGVRFAIFNGTEGYKGEATVLEIDASGRTCFARMTLKKGAVVIGDRASTNLARNRPNTVITPRKRKQIENTLGHPQLGRVVFRYAHKTADTRRSFAETLFWKPFLVTDDKGEATIEFDVSDSVTTWKIYANAHGNGRVGQAEASFESYLPFFMEPKVPTRVSEGDVLHLPVSLVADDANEREATIVLSAQGPLTLENTGSHPVPLLDGRGRVLARLIVGEPQGAGDTGSISIRGRVGKARDVVGRRFAVVPRGFPHRFDHAGKVQGRTELTVHVPDDLGKRTAVLKLHFYPSPLANLEDALAGMLQEPHGCFEQVSSSNHPNVMVLSLLRSSGDNIPAAAAKAQRLLASGYKKLIGYEVSGGGVSGGGYEWWGKDPAHAALTAYGLLQFTDMAQVFEVDQEMVTRTRAWLLGKRDGKGGFLTGTGRYGHFMGGSKEARNAYIAYALLYSGEASDNMSAELDALEQRAKDTDDAYELAVIACALAEANRPSAGAARTRLLAMRHKDGSLLGTGSITGSGKRDLRVETTSFAVLAWLAADGHDTEVARAVRFLETQRQGGGTFGGTQATVVALQALTAYLAANTPSIAPGTLKVFINDKEVRTLQLSGTEKRTIAIDHLGRALSVGDNKVRFELSNGNEFPFSVELTYRADQPKSNPDCVLDLNTWLNETVLAEGDTTALHAVVRNTSKQPVANPMVIVGLPAGLHVDAKILDDLKKSETIAAWELIDNDIALYLRGLKAEESRDIVIDLTGRIPGVTKGAASRAYLYYAGREKKWTAPIQVEVTAGR